MSIQSVGVLETEALCFRPNEAGGYWAEWHSDAVALEEPIELRLTRPAEPLTLAVLMRTPAHDRELLTGWLISEGLWTTELKLVPDEENPNVWHLFAPQPEALEGAARLGVSSSACGVCGTGSIERLSVQAARPMWAGQKLPPELIASLPERLHTAQAGFALTGGLHAAGLFDSSGTLRAAFEDVGRHNATDKVIGWAADKGLFDQSILCVSSRAGFEIVQKAIMAGVAVVVTVGAASSLAVQTAQTFGVTLCAFTRQGKFNVYSGEERILTAPAPQTPPHP